MDFHMKRIILCEKDFKRADFWDDLVIGFGLPLNTTSIDFEIMKYKCSGSKNWNDF